MIIIIITWTVDDRRLSGSIAQSFAVTIKLYELFVSRSTRRFVRIVPFAAITKSSCSSPAVIVYSIRPLSPIIGNDLLNKY